MVQVSGTTATVAVIVGWDLLVASVGDSEAYLDTGAEVVQVWVAIRKIHYALCNPDMSHCISEHTERRAGPCASSYSSVLGSKHPAAYHFIKCSLISLSSPSDWQ